LAQYSLLSSALRLPVVLPACRLPSHADGVAQLAANVGSPEEVTYHTTHGSAWIPVPGRRRCRPGKRAPSYKIVNQCCFVRRKTTRERFQELEVLKARHGSTNARGSGAALTSVNEIRPNWRPRQAPTSSALSFNFMTEQGPTNIQPPPDHTTQTCHLMGANAKINLY
jgi:hypothetical protein